ncbi:MAG: zinc-dependent metalloprotease family protein [Nonlabens ulvanivorans]|uniref:reprolysin-like metallopeptidase n=7 Tax=Nonlabens ulvanivorans TaxID=906888 RepID=UPI003264A080
MKKIVLILVFLSVSLSYSQGVIWENFSKDGLPSLTDAQRPIKPASYNLYHINPDALVQKLEGAVDRFSGGASIAVDFPIGNDQFETFNVYDAGAMEFQLMTDFPNIHSYYGYSDTSLNKIYFTITPQGFRGVITGESILYMDPFSKVTPDDIMVYNRRDLVRTDLSFECHTDELVNNANMPEISEFQTKAFRDRAFRTYEIAIAATSEYTSYHDDGNAANGDARADALAAIIVTLARVNSVYEQEMSIRFTLVANNDRLIYFNDQNNQGFADPYDNYSGSQMLGTNTSNINNRIGTASYDIGHVFSTGGGGIAGQSPCASTKGRGVTGIVTPEFDPFDIDYVCHEIGHQFSAEHTFYNGCFGGSPSSSPYETGSASTIMGYAGICAPNVQENSDAYFHAISLQQMHNNIASDTCDDQINLGSNNPTAPNAVTFADKFLPVSTPFKLTAVSSQAPDNGEIYTYNWEQLDTGGDAATGSPQPPLSTNTTGPMFRSKFGTADPTRYFPNLEEVLNGVDDQWETISSVGRDMTFIVTIRDNNPFGGQTSQSTVAVKPRDIQGIGAFVVNTPVLTDIWYEGENQTVTWDVSGTNRVELATEVNILLSLDGGYTYPFTLASAVPNVGSSTVNIPVGAKTENARIMVEAVDNYFYNVNNGNFQIKEGTFELSAPSVDISTCQPSDASFSFNYNAAPGFNEVVTFSALQLPSGLTASFSPSSASSSTAVNVVVAGTDQVDADLYNFRVVATANTATIDEEFNLKVFDNGVGEVVILSPLNGAGNQVANPILEWQDLPSASSYLVEVSSTSDFSSIIESSTVINETSLQTTSLNPSQIYYWRITPSNGCATGSIASIAVFQTAQDVCNVYDNEYFENNDNIWETDVNAVSARVNVPDDIEITNLSFYMRADHNDTGHIKMQLSSPSGRFSEVYNRECAAGRDFDLIVSDQGTAAFACNPGYTGALTGNLRPGQAFSRFNGLSAQGEWVLLATDRTSGTGGTFNEFSVTVCGRLQYVNDIDNNRNNLLTTAYGATSIIDQTLLRTQQTGTTNANMIYVVTRLPKQGGLELSSVALNLGDTFTQSDLNNDRIVYNHDSTEMVLTDSFDFTVLGNANTLMNAQTFNIAIEEPTLIYDNGWTPFAPNADTGSLNAQVINGLAIIGTDSQINNFQVIGNANSLFLNNTLTVLGDFSTDGYIGATDGQLIFSGSGAQSISGDGIIDIGQVSMTGSNTISITAVMNIHNVFTPASTTINTNGNIVFRSDVNRTAQLDDASSATINGVVQVERYVPAKRAFRLIASSVNSTNSIYENWQENGSAIAGLGTHITGSLTGANGFDLTASGNPSMFTYDAVNSVWASQPNTDVDKLQVGTAYRLMVRGDRTVDITQNTPAATNTTLRAKGNLHLGDFNSSLATSNGDFIMIANPYQANVDFKTVLNDVSTSGVNVNFAYYWDPNLNTRGAYATIDMSTLNGDPIPFASNANKYLQPGQSIFIQATGAANITFKESHKKVSEDLNNIFNQPQNNSSVLISLVNRSTQTIVDQTVRRINSANNPQIDQSDAVKFYNQDETLAIVNNGNLLSIDKNIMPVVGDHMTLLTDRFRATQYTMQVLIDGLVGVKPVLIDHYTTNRTDLVEGANSIDFDVLPGDAASNDINRFEIVFENVTLSSNDINLQADLRLFPNPVSSGQFTIQSDLLNGKEVQVSLYNTLGQLIHDQEATFNNSLIIKPQSNLSSGMYLVKVSTLDESATLQIIVK